MIEEFVAEKERVIAHLRQRRADAKGRMDAAAEEYKAADEAIAALERVDAGPEAKTGPVVMVEANEFAGYKTPPAVAAILIRNPRPMRKSEIVNALERGGLAVGKEIHKIQQNVGGTLKLWRRSGWATLNEAESTWQLTGRGRVELSRPAAARDAANERSLFASEA